MVRPGYKQTEVGEIPEDWETSKFIDVTTLITCGIAATPHYVSEWRGYPFLSSTNVKAGRIVWSNFKYISPELHHQLYKNNPPKKGDVLYSRVGTIGEAAVIEVDFEFSVYVSLTLIKPKPFLDSYFLMHLLNSNPYKQRAYEQVYLGGGVGNLNVDVVRNYPIPIPPLEEQHTIAEALSDVDGLLEGLTKLIAKKRAIMNGTMQQLLTGKTRLPGFGEGQGYKQTEVGEIPEDWDVVDVGTILSFVVDNRGKTPPLARDGYPLVEVNAIYCQGKFPNYALVTKYVDESTYTKWFRDGHPQAGDTLIVTVGSAGTTCYVKEDKGCIAQNIIALRVNEDFSPEYFYYSTLTSFFQKQVQAVLMGGVQPSLKVPHLKSFKLPIASHINEQQAIATVLSDMDKEIESMEARLAKIRAIKQGMMQELLTGRTRLL